MCTQLNCFKHHYETQFNLISVICLHTGKWLKSSIWFIYGTLTSTTTPGQSEPGSNGNEGVLHIPQSFRTGASPSDSLFFFRVKSQNYCIYSVLGNLLFSRTLYILGTRNELRDFSLTTHNSESFYLQLWGGLFLVLQDSWCLGLLDVWDEMA